MKKFLPIVALLLMCLGCAPPNKTSKVNSNPPSPQQEKKVDSSQQIAPGTCYLSLKDCVLLTEGQKLSLKATVNKVHSYGAGFTEVFQKNQEIVIRINEKDKKVLSNKESISCIVTQVTKMNNKSYLQLAEIK